MTTTMRRRARWTTLLLLSTAATLACTSAQSRAISSPTASTPAAAVARPDASALRERWLEMFARGYFPGRSGQVFYVPREGDFIVSRKEELYTFMHGSPWSYDTRIPLLFHGPGFIRSGEWSDAVTQQDVVPTLGALVGVTPATATGRVLTQILNPVSTKPRVIVLLVFDGMRVDYFDTYRDALPTLTRVRREGAWFSNANVNFLPTVTAVGHATLGTGTDPRVHGLVANMIFNRVSGKSQEAYDGLDPRELMALTLADVWNVATDGRAVIIGQGGAIRATAGLVGRGACVINGRKVIAASYAARGDGGWETNPACYTMSEALKPIVARRYWEEAKERWMGHDIANASRFRASSLFQRFEGDALVAVLEHEAIGADDVTDLVMVNLKGPDYVGHAYGPASAEIREEMAELDRQMARVLQTLDRKAGAGRSVVAIAADHGMPAEPASGQRRFFLDDVAAAIHKRFDPSGRTVIQYLGDAANSQVHLDTAKLATLGVSLKDVATFLETEFFAAAFTEDEVRAAQARLRR
jgi:hypothetical protein